MKLEARVSGPDPLLRTFLIADIHGYMRFTREHGDAEAARLAEKFADVARDSVEARGGRVIELRGDEARAVFVWTAQAVRAALELQAACSEETAGEPALPLTVGIGLDVGEETPVEKGFRALNTAARLCSKAAAGQVLVTRAVAELAGEVEEVRFEERGADEFKEFEQTVPLEAVSLPPPPEGFPAPAPGGEPTSADWAIPPPPELDSITPLVDRVQEMRWLRGTWRQAGRGRGRLVFVSGPSQIGKTRLAAELASEIGRGGHRVLYAGPGGAAAAMAMAAVREATDAVAPTLVVLDDLDVAGEEAARTLAQAHDRIRSRPVLAIGLVKDPEAGPALAAIIDKADRFGDGHVPLSALDIEGVEGIARLYVGDDVEVVPLESMLRASGGVPGRVHEVVSEWTREAGRRLAAAAEWLAEGRGRPSADLALANNLIGLKLGRLHSGTAPGGADAECPYKGLASFEEADAAHFFGRERLVVELAARTVQNGLLGVVGASGSGKSSVVAAGVLPSLRAGLLPGSERWRHVVFRPGEHPMAELTAAVSPVAPASSDGDVLEAATDAVGPDGRLVVAVDQFEEVFTLCTDEDERASFIEAITGAATRWPERTAFVLTIRDDFYDRCAPYRDLAELLIANHVLVPAMTSDQLRRAIELPARGARLRVEAALVEALVREAADEPGGLPLLSAALVELWQAREAGWLRMAAYERAGGVRGAVARLAEASYQQLTDAEREVARRIFLRLSGIGERDLVTRRRVQTSELDVETDPVAADLLARLTRDRLLTMSDSSVEVAHEALLREWPRLRVWLEEDVQGHQLRQHLTHAAKQWDETGRDPSAVYRGARLSAALDWASTRGRDLNELERAFLAASRQASARQAERRRKTNRRLRGLLAGTTASLLVLAGGLALVQRFQDVAERTEKQARIASARELAAAAVANLDVDPERSILLALQAVDATWEADRTVEPEAEEALHRALRRSRVVLSVPQGGGLAVSADGTRFGTTGQDGTAVVWDTETGERLLTLRGHDGAVNGIAFSPNGNRLATAGSDGTVRLWDGASGRQIQVLRGHKGPVWTPAFSPDGRLLATTGEDTTIRIWDARTGREKMVLTGHEDKTISGLLLPVRPVFSPDGSRLASARWDGSTRIWDLATGETLVVLSNHIWEATDVAFSGDGRRVATSSLDGTARIWGAASGDRLLTLSGHTGEVHSVDYSPDGGRIATGGVDGTTLVWDAATGEQIMALSGQTKEVRRVAFTPDGDRLFTASADGTTRLWDISVGGGRDWLTVPAPHNRLGGLAFSPDGRTFAVPRDPAGVTIRDVDTGAQVITLTDHDASVWDVDFSPDGSRLAAAAGTGKGNRGANRTLPIWDVNTGKLVMTLMGHGGDLAAVAFSPDGRRLVATSYDGTLRVWDAATGKQRRVVKVGAHGHGLGFSPDGRWLLASIGEEGIVAVFDAATLERRGELRGHTDYIQDIEFGPDGRVVTASGDGTAKIWDLSSRREVDTLRVPTGAVLSVAVSPVGDLIATASADGTVKLWDAATGRQWLTLFGHNRTVYGAAFSPDGRLFATASVDGTVALYLLPIDELRELARDRVTRTLTDEECGQYLHVEKCPAGI